jgi:molybdopterin/thiamine biosynthesis adenylyltransferase
MKEIFKYPDTNSSRAEIEYLNRKFKGLKIAIIGLGGTGSYILDLVSKTPVQEIHIYDRDIFQLHNAFRAPGAIEGKLLDGDEELKKVDYYYSVYSKMHNGIVPHAVNVTDENVEDLCDFDYIFISVDKNKVRSELTKAVLSLKVPFIDAGLGVNKIEDELIGTLRVTTGTDKKNDHLEYRIGADEFDDNGYGTNIQIADLNCFSAVLAVIKWKKMCGFYQDQKHEHNILYFINTNKLMNEDFGA